MLDFVTNFAAACRPGSGGNLLGFPTWYKYLEGETIRGKCSVVFDFRTDIGAVLLAVFEIILRVGALVSIGFVIYGGFQYILSQGEAEQTKGARSTIINAVIGLVITISATAIVNLIARNVA